MQSSLQQNLSTKNPQKTSKESSSGTTVTNSTEDSATNSEVVKKKRKRNRKKNKSNQVVQKVENLISKTFQAKLEAENNKIKINEEQFDNSLKMDKEKTLKNSKAPIKNTLSPTKNPISPTKKPLSPTKTVKKLENPTNSLSSSDEKSVVKQGEKTMPVKSREEILTEIESKKISKPSVKNKNEPQKNSLNVLTSTNAPAEKTREEILAEREAKKLAKQLSKNKNQMEKTTTSILSPNASAASAPEPITQNTEKSREEVIAEREAKKLAKQLSKNKNQMEKTTTSILSPNASAASAPEPITQNTEKSREEIIAEREAKKLAKQLGKKMKVENNIDSVDCAANIMKNDEIKILTNNIKNVHIAENIDKKILSKAERRAIQEAQRAAKAKLLVDKQIPKKTTDIAKTPAVVKKSSPLRKDCKIGDNKNFEKSHELIKNLSNECKVKLFNHLDYNMKEKNLFINHSQIHPAMVRLGEQFAKRTVVGSNARCIAFLNALKMVIQDYETPPKKEFTRGLESIIKNCVDHLHQCRPLAVSISNAHKYIKLVLTQLGTDQPESELKEYLCELIDTYIKDQIEKAALAISSSVQEKISNGDVILTFGCSSLINHILEEANLRKIDFRVIVVDSRPFSEGQELLRRLVTKEIPCTYVLINAVGFIMPEVTKVLLGAHSLLANGYVMARTGTAQVALVARSFNVPVLVCCETHKFSERVQTDAIVYNELGNPHDLVINQQCKLLNWQNSNHKLSPLNLNFDITPPELVTAVVTEVAILPCTSVPVILRLKPTEIGY